MVSSLTRPALFIIHSPLSAYERELAPLVINAFPQWLEKNDANCLPKVAFGNAPYWLFSFSGSPTIHKLLKGTEIDQT